MITLWGGPTPNARKISIALEEMELEWSLETIDILAGDQLTPAFLALNPNNKTPVIVDHDGPDGADFVLWESGAILLYLAQKTGRFLPADPARRAVCWQWLMFQVSGIGPMFGQAAHFVYYAKDKHPYAIERYSREVSRLMRVLDQRLAAEPWVAGDQYTIADMAMLPYVGVQSGDRALRPAVKAGMALGQARPETIEGGMQGFNDEHRSILWGERQHAAR